MQPFSPEKRFLLLSVQIGKDLDMWIILGVVFTWVVALALCRTASDPEPVIEKQIRDLLEHAKCSPTIQ